MEGRYPSRATACLRAAVNDPDNLTQLYELGGRAQKVLSNCRQRWIERDREWIATSASARLA